MKTRIKNLFGAALCLLITLGLTHDTTAQPTTRITFQASVTVKTPKPVTANQIFSMNPDGTSVAQLTSASAGAINPSWSPGQQYISFWRDGTLFVMEAIGEANGGRTFAVAPAVNWASDWSPDGSSICFMQPGGDLCIVSVNAATGGVGTPVVVRQGECFWPAWSPDGTRIAFCASDDGGTTQDIKVLELATSAEVSFRVGPIGSYNFDPRWSPDGTRIAFVGPAITTTTTRKGTMTSTYGQIFFADADGANIRRVTFVNINTFFPAWSPDGGTLAFANNASGTAGIYQMPADGGAVTLGRQGGNAPDWNP